MISWIFPKDEKLHPPDLDGLNAISSSISTLFLVAQYPGGIAEHGLVTEILYGSLHVGLADRFSACGIWSLPQFQALMSLENCLIFSWLVP